jgi:hypothetical protein
MSALLHAGDVLDNALARLDEFLLLEPGWDSYDADRISPTAVKAARGLLMLSDGRLQAHGGATPTLPGAPLADGGVQVEWHTHSQSLEVDAQTDGSLGYLLVSRTNSGDHFQERDQASLDEIEALLGA